MATIDVFNNETNTKVLAAGEFVFLNGEAGDCMYAVLEGCIEIRRGDLVLLKLGPGEIFGEMAIIDKRPRSADAVAVVPSRVAVVGERRFLMLVQQTPFFALQMMRVLTDRLRATGTRPPIPPA